MKKVLVLAMNLVLVAAVAVAAETVQPDISLLPNPLDKVQPGQWVQYRILTAFGHIIQKQSVVSVSGAGEERIITVKTEMSMDDELVDERTDTITYRRAMEEQMASLQDTENLAITATTIDLKGRTVDAVKVEFTDEDKKCTLILTENVPFAGMVSLEIEDMEEPAMELVDFNM